MSENISVFMVVNLTINDPDEYRIYEKGFFSFLHKLRRAATDITLQRIKGLPPRK